MTAECQLKLQQITQRPYTEVQQQAIDLRLEVFEQLHSKRQEQQDLTRWLQQQQQQQQRRQQQQQQPTKPISQFSDALKILDQNSKKFSATSAFFKRPNNFTINSKLGVASSTKPIGSPLVDAPFSRFRPGDHDASRPFVNNNIPVGLPRETTALLAALEITKRVDVCPVSTTDTEGWKMIEVGVDSCAAESVTPLGLFPTPVQLTARVGEEYTCANDTVIYNQGQQTVSALTNDWVPVSSTFQVTDVNKPLDVCQAGKR